MSRSPAVPTLFGLPQERSGVRWTLFCRLPGRMSIRKAIQGLRTTLRFVLHRWLPSVAAARLKTKNPDKVRTLRNRHAITLGESCSNKRIRIVYRFASLNFFSPVAHFAALFRVRQMKGRKCADPRLRGAEANGNEKEAFEIYPDDGRAVCVYVTFSVRPGSS